MYATLAPYYDELFPASEASARFLSSRCRAGGRVLDIACGVGAHTRRLAQYGFEAVGIDLDAEMISYARDMGGEETCEFIVGDMLRLPDILSDRPPFDFAYCLGNSIVHLDGIDLVSACISAIAGILTSGGSCAVQIVNFDRPDSLGTFEFEPLISNDHRVKFDRRYEAAGPSGVVFHTILSVDGTMVSENRIPLVALLKDELSGMFADAGFVEIEAFGSFSSDPWDAGGFLTIVSGRLP